MNSHVPVVIGGISIADWVDLHRGCHTESALGASQFAWPDGLSYLEQDNLTITIFRMINEQIRKVNS